MSLGAGRSSDLPADFGLSDYALCLAALIDALALGPAHVAGLSWGGTVAQELYRRYPQLVATLILIDTYAGSEEVDCPGSRFVPGCGVGQLIKCLQPPPRSSIRRFPACLSAATPPAEFVPLLEEIAILPPSAPKASDAAVRRRPRPTSTDLLPLVTVPTLLIWGRLRDKPVRRSDVITSSIRPSRTENWS